MTLIRYHSGMLDEADMIEKMIEERWRKILKHETDQRVTNLSIFS